MNLIKYTFLITSFLFFLIKNSFACEIKARVSVVGNEFPAIQTVGAGAKKCKGAEVKTNLTADHQKINVAGMSSEPAEYTSAIVANTSIVALLNNDLINIAVRPNPTTGQIYLNGLNDDLDLKKIELRNSIGELIRKWGVDDLNIGLSDFSNGLYYLHLFLNEDEMIIKVIKQ